MGYADTLPYQQVTLKSGLKVSFIDIGTVATDWDIGTITIPNFKRPISLAYLDIHVQRCTNDNVATNYMINAGSFGIVDSGATYWSAQAISGNTCYTSGGATWDNHLIIPGSTDIHAYITPGATHTIQFQDIRSNSDSLHLLEVYAELRIYFSI